jgi:hypothetical protein
VQPYEHIERKDAIESGGKRVPNSGRLWHSKGDVKTEVFLRDTKDSREAKTFSLRFAQLEKHLHDAQREGLIGMIVVYWKDSLGRVRKLCMVEESVLDPLLEGEVDGR